MFKAEKMRGEESLFICEAWLIRGWLLIVAIAPPQKTPPGMIHNEEYPVTAK